MQPTELARLLLDSKNYREFLSRFFSLAKEQSRSFSYASFAKKAGFSARSYPRDVVSGGKRITLASLPKFIHAIKLRGDLKTYFTLLVAVDEADVNVGNLSRAELETKLAKLRTRAQRRLHASARIKPADFYCSKNWQDIYASLGRPGTGASVREISGRTGLSEQACQNALAELMERKLVRIDLETGRYHGQDLHLVFDDLGKDGYFRQYFLESLKGVGDQARANFDTDECLFLGSVLSIEREKLPLFKHQLRELIIRFVDSAENAEGDGLAKLVVGLVPHLSQQTFPMKGSL